MNYGESKAVTALKGLAGAVIGAVPGMALWIILGKLGFVFSAVGLLIAMGIIFGYGFLTKNGELPLVFTVVICAAVFVLTMIISQKIIWTWELSSNLKDYLPTFREDIISGIMSESSEITRKDVEAFLTDEMYKEFVNETFGVTEGTFGECFANFSTLLEKLDMKSDYIFSLIKSGLFGLVGGIAVFAKTGRG